MEERNNNLPIEYKKKSISVKTIKDISKRTLKVIGNTAMLFGEILITGAVPLTFPITVPLMYKSAQNISNNTFYKSYADIMYITSENKNRIKLFQDPTRVDVARETYSMSKEDKKGFLELQTILALLKLPQGKIITTDSHGVTMKTLKILQEKGFIKDYQESQKKKSLLILPKIAFGNFKGLTKSVDMYSIAFKRTDKEIDMEEIINTFPRVRDVINKRGYKVEKGENGEYIIKYKTKSKEENTCIYEECNNSNKEDVRSRYKLFDINQNVNELHHKEVETNINRSNDNKNKGIEIE